ncbi:MAG: flavodoxin-dependent (E)-4-hydroxy-3-methylbut-2-enyl-diphosphate synthase [Clostridia bacterium]|nr:flavodoxin-dependent (E)-4-hydroxy-3-methylbut-2-enyl-diphosphate synthase [Clostridia bacterium]
MTKRVSVGGVLVGGGERVKIQSMTTTKTADVEKTVAQINALCKAGCEIVRVAIADEADAAALKRVKNAVSLPIVADIHFSPVLAVQAIENGADKVRINPGNIGGEKEIAFVADCVKAHGIPVRVGANTGSIETGFLKKYGRSERALVESALYNVGLLEKHGVQDLVISVKASDVPLTVRAYRLLAQSTKYPLHVGVTEAGTKEKGIIKSAAGIGALLVDGIGDTIRVSLSDDPVEEVLAAKEILRACGLGGDFVEVVSCPTCGRCEWDSLALANKVTEFVAPYSVRAKVAVMGCVVNGPGEAKDADLGIAGGKGSCLIFKKGVPYKKVEAANAEQAFMEELKGLLNNGK